MNAYGRKLLVSIFGESHSEAIGVTIDGLPPGFCIDMDDVRFEMSRRAPGKSELSTPRNEADDVRIICGYWNGKTTGSPLTALINNTDTRSKDYEQDLMRPSHADYVAFSKFGGAGDYRGGGHFSGRITAPLVFAGAVAKQILSPRGIVIGGYITKIGSVSMDAPDDLSTDVLREICKRDFPALNDDIAGQMKREIQKAKEEFDSVGGIVRCQINGVDKFIGSPFFGSIESALSSIIFSIPAVKGIAFGKGFELAEMRGSQANDEMFFKNGKVVTKTNNNGGINGGIANLMPIVFDVALKPTPSIFREQDTVNVHTKTNEKITIKGRHDPSIVPRAVPVIECAAAVAILDAYLLEGGVL